MPHRHVQHLGACPVVDGQLHLNLGDRDIAHDTGSADVEDFVVVSGILPVGERGGEVGEGGVVGVRFHEEAFLVAGVHLFDGLVIGGDGTCLDTGIPPVADSRVQHHGEPHQQQHDQYGG